MAKTLILKNTGLGKEEIKRLKKEFPFLKESDIADILHWHEKYSPYYGVVIDEDAQFQAYPYAFPEEEFLKDFPDGKHWK